MTLRSRLLRGLLAVAIVPILIVAVMGRRTSYQIDYAASSRLLESRATAIQRRVDDYVEKHAAAMEALASAAPSIGSAKRRAWVKTLRLHQQLYSGFLAVLVADPEGRVQWASLSRKGAPPEIRSGGEVGDREYFAGARGGAGSYVSSAFRGKLMGTDPLVAISHSILDARGRFAGIVAGALDLQRFQQFAGDYGSAEVGGLLILDRRNRVTYASGSTSYHFLDDLSTSPLISRKPGEVFTAELRVPGADRSRAFLVGRAQAQSPYGWRVYVFDPLEHFNAVMKTRLIGSLTGLIVGIAISLLLARPLATSITRPLERLARRVRGVGEDGSLPPGEAVDRRRWRSPPAEVVELSSRFESMAARLSGTLAELRGLNGELEKRVALRTADLERSNAELQAAIRRRLEAEGELLLRDRAMAATSEGIAIVDESDPSKPLVYVNSGFERLTGYSAAEALGRNLAFLAGPETDFAETRKMIAAAARREPVTTELLSYRKDGGTFWNRVSLTPVADPSGKITHSVAVLVDLTQHKELERLKNELVSTVSHELRTPLTSLRGFAELMLERDFPPERSRQFVSIIHKESCRLTGLISDFLDIQRMESGRQITRKEDFELESALRESVGALAGEQARYAVSVEVEPAGLRVHADPEQIRRLIGNLLSNARKFSPNGGPIEIGARPAGREVVVWVRDHGLGVPEDAIPKLFTRFYRVDNTETRKIGGAGLGLEICRKIVELHNGRIWVESRLGEGSTFQFTLEPASAGTPAGEPVRTA
jgi:PAS domain S-box-containing protein